MPIIAKDNRVLVNCVDGDVIFSPATETGNPDIFLVVFENGNKYPIDKTIDELKGTQITNWAVRMDFATEASIDSLIHVLEDIKKEKREAKSA